jgi:hypothetical protein
MQAYAAKLIELIELKAENIAKQWATDVMKHPRTPSYSSLPLDRVIERGVNFYRLFRQMSLADNSYEAAKTFSWKYAEQCHREKIPLQEAVYALILLRRHLWLYAEFQGTFVTALEMQQAVESLNRTILMFDYVAYQVIEKYQELINADVDKKLSAIKTMTMMSKPISGKRSNYKVGLIGLLLLVACILTYYYHSSMGTGTIFTHLFYIPIILASIWWGKKGIFAAIFLAVLILASHALFLKATPFIDDIIRAIMFLIIGGVVGWLMEGIRKIEDMYKATIKI